MRRAKPRLPIQELVERTLQMIEAYSGRPAPTRDDIAHWTGLRRREIAPFLESLRQQGVIAVHRKGRAPNHFFRFKVIGGRPATLWTMRKKPLGRPRRRKAR